MVLPPATPAPSRFLSSKKPSTQQCENQTQNQNYPRGSSQFFVTPRFATATPRPSATQATAAFATPALAIKSRAPRNRSTQDIIDDSSPVSPKYGSPSSSPNGHATLPEPIEFDSSLVPQSPSPGELTEGRSPKRRRISIASCGTEADLVVNSQGSQDSDLEILYDAPGDHIVSYYSDVEDEGDRDPVISSTQSITSSPTHSQFTTVKTDEASELDGSGSEPSRGATDQKATPKPTTGTKDALPRTAPRFKLTEPPDRLPSDPEVYLAADLFSPQRRGTKYLPGGLAAELRDWLVDVKGELDRRGEVKATSSTLRSTAAAGGGCDGVVKLVVEEVSRGGPGMTLVSGKVLDGECAKGPDGRTRVILAGGGNIEGLGGGKGGGNPRKVAPGAVVAVDPPAWDVELGGQWAVACRWEVVDGEGGDVG
ncbi:uncharacterized protein P884DRAFT_198838 [Thermothelomyces heterothallicus CBS 202.75]|uniref:uncharacterized protein n=1 Tax=Thermothelomyces heterothallicus CBS 202.75 TaxID=1149848 RepID=UPI0037421374